MHTTIKLAVAGSLVLAAAAANATIANPSTGASDVLLFAEVLNGSTVVASYGGDTGISVTAAYSGTSQTFAATANLSALFAADVAGDTLVWAVEGGQYTGTNSAATQAAAGKSNLVTTAVNPAQIPTKTSAGISTMNTVLNNTIATLNTNIGAGSDVEGAAASTAGVWDSNTPAGISAWGGISSVITGTGTTNLYSLTGTGSATGKLVAVSNGTVTLSASGLVFAATSTTPPAVPLPPAAWLLGSGLLGLAGIARRKSKA